jgi:hypothetical protein
MKKLSANSQGFITMIVAMLIILVIAVVVVYLRVSQASR